jgi:hypothetical protein
LAGFTNVDELDMAAALFESELVGDDVVNGAAFSAAAETTETWALDKTLATVGEAMTGGPGVGSCPTGGAFEAIAIATAEG